MGKRLDIKAGDRFGKLTVIREVEPNVTPSGAIQRKYLCHCDCGNYIIRTKTTLFRGAHYGCGCAQSEITRVISDEEYALYSIWHGMRSRCLCPTNNRYKNYGGRGIKICPAWDDYLTFYRWGIANGYKKGLSIDRIDVDGDYCPENCRWADNNIQNRNKTTTRYLEYNGKRQSLQDWSEELNIHRVLLTRRLDVFGWSVGEALGFEKHINNKPKYNSIPINLINKNGDIITRYNSATEAATDNNLSVDTILTSCRDLRITACGKCFSFEGEEGLKRRGCKRSKAVQQFDMNGKLIKEWDSVQNVADEPGFSVNTLRICCAGGYKHMYGYKWAYKDSDECIAKMSNPKVCKSVLQFSKNGTLIAEYKSVLDAAKATNNTTHNIYNALRGTRGIKNSGGFVWRYKENEL